MFFIPKSWADRLQLIGNPFNHVDYECVEVDDVVGNSIIPWLNNIMNHEDSAARVGYAAPTPPYGAVAVQSNTAGFKIILHYLCDDAYVENAIGDEGRETAHYRQWSRWERPRFDSEVMLQELARVAAPVEVVETVGTAPTSAQIIDDATRLFDSMCSKPNVDMQLLRSGNGKALVLPSYMLDNGFDAGLGLDMVETFDKHVLIVTTTSQKTVASTIPDSFICVCLNPDVMPGIKPQFIATAEEGDGDRVPCLGSYCSKILTPRKTSIHQFSKYFGLDRLWVDEATGVAYASRKDNFIYIMVVFRNYGEYEAVFRRIVQKWKGRISTKTEDRGLLKLTVECDRSKFIDQSASGANAYIEEIEEKLTEVMETTKKLQQELVDALKMQRQLHEIVSAFDRDKYNAEQRQKAEDRFRQVMLMPKIKSMYVEDDGKLTILTHSIHCMDPRTKKLHDIGKLMVTLNMLTSSYSSKGNVVVKNLSHMVEGYGGHAMVAPHIYEDGHMCHGSLLSMITQHYAERDVYAIMQDLFAFFESVNVDDPAGKEISKWPVVGEVHPDTDTEVDPTDNELIANLKGVL